MLFAVPNVSEGRDAGAIEAIGRAFASAPGVRLLDVHSDADHHRSVFWLAGGPGELAEALVRGAREALARVDLATPRGTHPHVGALDVAPVVHLDAAARGAACAEALLAAARLGEEGASVFLYGALAGGRTRAELRRGGPAELARRVAAGELRPDFGPQRIDPRRGATLVAARPPLVAFNLEIDGDAELAREIATGLRALPGVRSLGLWLERAGLAQVSCNVEDPAAVPLARLLAEVRARTGVREAELVGLAPAAAFAGWPEDVRVRNRRTVEDVLGS